MRKLHKNENELSKIKKVQIEKHLRPNNIVISLEFPTILKYKYNIYLQFIKCRKNMKSSIYRNKINGKKLKD